MLNSVSRLYRKNISSKGISIFRILFSLNLFLEVLRIYRFRELYFDPIPFIESATTNYSLYLVLWLLVLGLLIIGAFTRIMSIANYLLTVFFISSIGSFEYHMDYVYLGVGFLMMLAPLSRSFSVDRWYHIRKVASNSHVSLRPETVPAIYYNLLFIVGIGFVYFGSVFFKFKSDMWMSGLGIWLPSSIPQVTILNDQWLLNQEYLMKFFGYFTLLFEIVVPFVFFIKSLRFILFVIGVGLHIGILLEFPIPYFALGIAAIYFLIVPVGFWEKLWQQLKIKWFKSNSSMINALSDRNLDKTVVTSPSGFEKFKIIGLKSLVIVLLIFQFNATFNFPLSDGIVNFVTSRSESARAPIKSILQLKKRTLRFSKKYLGIGPHGVFIDSHFIGYDMIATVTYNGEMLPMYDQYGMPDDYLSGGSWANFNFRVNKPRVMNDVEGLKKGLIRYTSFWAHENNIDLANASFEIIMKEISLSFEWEKDLLKKNRANPWAPIGTLHWKEFSPTFDFDK